MCELVWPSMVLSKASNVCVSVSDAFECFCVCMCMHVRVCEGEQENANDFILPVVRGAMVVFALSWLIFVRVSIEGCFKF